MKETERGIQVIYGEYNVGCMVTAPLMMIVGSLVLFWILEFKALLVGTIGLVFFGGVLLKIISVLRRKNRILFEIVQDGIVYKNRKVDFLQLAEISIGYHNHRLIGLVFPDIIIRTATNQSHYISTYNLVDLNELEKIVSTYIIPYSTIECQEAWQKNRQPFI
jgi:hypothetical protein